VADDADHLAAGVQGIEGVQGDVQHVGVDGAEAFVEEERVDRGLVAEQIGQRQADQEIFASGERALAIRSGVGGRMILGQPSLLSQSVAASCYLRGHGIVCQYETWLRRLPCQPETLSLPIIRPTLLSS
jgi:hypothetical protein